VAEFAALADRLKPRFPDWPVDYGYLEFARPVIRDGLDRLVAQGVRHILAVPGMLFAATHVKNDLPWELNTFMAENPGVEIRFGRDLGIDPKLLQASADRIAEAEQRANAERTVGRADTLLMVVGRGTTDPDANSNICKIARMLWEGMGFGWAETAFSGVAVPRVDTGLKLAARLGFKRIIVFPYFLFTGILIKRIYEQTDQVAQLYPEIEFVKSGYLRDHALVLDTFAERVVEMLEGAPAMNCQLCKFRTQVIGYEDAAGAPQAGHHHHVAGIGTDAHSHHHGHGHDHHHHHGDGHDHHHHHGHGHDHHDHGDGHDHHHHHGDSHDHDPHHGHSHDHPAKAG
jgi:sirohydrochlorin cobaltochelatase